MYLVCFGLENQLGIERTVPLTEYIRNSDDDKRNLNLYLSVSSAEHDMPHAKQSLCIKRTDHTDKQMRAGTFRSMFFQPSYASVGRLLSRPSSETVHSWREEGHLNTVLATTSTLTPTLGSFSYGPDTIASFDVRFDNVRIRPFAFPEPQTTVGPEQVIGVRVLNW